MSDIIPMTADEVFTRAKLGSLVRYYDDESRPSPRNKTKMREWKLNNGMGYLIRLEPGLESRPTQRPTFTIRERIGIDHKYDLDSTLMFDVRPPIPGTILAYTERDDVKEIKHVWYGPYEAHRWARLNDCNLDRCGLRYLLVLRNGEQIPHRIPKKESFTVLENALIEVIEPCFT